MSEIDSVNGGKPPADAPERASKRKGAKKAEPAKKLGRAQKAIGGARTFFKAGTEIRDLGLRE